MKLYETTNNFKITTLFLSAHNVDGASNLFLDCLTNSTNLSFLLKDHLAYRQEYSKITHGFISKMVVGCEVLYCK